MGHTKTTVGGSQHHRSVCYSHNQRPLIQHILLSPLDDVTRTNDWSAVDKYKQLYEEGVDK